MAIADPEPCVPRNWKRPLGVLGLYRFSKIRTRLQKKHTELSQTVLMALHGWGERGHSALDTKQLVFELKRQRRHLEQAIAALEAIERNKRRLGKSPVSRKPRVARLALMRTGTGGQVIPISTATRSSR